MATYRKRGDTWRAEVKLAGVRESATFRGRAQAVAWAIERETEINAGRRGQITHRTVRQALERYAQDVSPRHKGERWERVRLTKLAREIPFAGKRLADVTPAEIAGFRDAQRGVLAPSSIRREFGLLRAVFAVARREWGWLKVSPFEHVKAPAEGKPRTRRVSDAELASIVAALGWDGAAPKRASHFIAVACRLALETAMRQGELLRLTRADIAGKVAILTDTKNGTARSVPLSAAARGLLELLPARGRLLPVAPGSFDTLFRKARRKAGLVDLHFHDLRREATTRLAAKLDPMTLAKMTGHRDLRVLLATYYAPDMETVADSL